MWRFLLICAVFCLPIFASAETIPSFDITYDIEEAGTILVTERIVYDFETAERHGMFRTLWLSHPDGATAWYKKRVVGFELISVTRDGQTEPYELSGRETKEIKIGDAGSTMTGAHTYEIVYRLTGALRRIDNEESELYWNVTGNDWPLTISTVHFTARGAVDTSARCYHTVDDCVMTQTEDGTWTTNLANLAAGHELTVGIKTSLPASATVLVEEWRTDLLALLALIPLALLTVLAMWRYEYFYYRRQPIIAQYEPYEGVEPMYAGVLVDDSLGPKDITAGLLYLAEQGFVHIKRTEKKIVWLFNTHDYELTLKRPSTEVPSEFLTTVLSLIFNAGDTVGTTVLLSSIRSDSVRKMLNSKNIAKLNQALRADLVTRGYIESKRLQTRDYVAIGLFFALIIFAGMVQQLIGIGFYLVILVATLLYGVYTVVTYRRRTTKGYEAMNHLKGFREFLSVTDKDRFDFHNAPERSPEQFMQYLPYAIAFGVEEKWAAVFSDMEITAPAWYEGSANTFAATAFASDISSFTNTMTTSTSAASGGGSAGGGGGGGGGGSW